MADKYNFDLQLKSPKGHEIGIDTTAMYGYFTRRDGSEGGGLWFNLDTSSPDGSNRLELTDYDGMAVLPLSIVETLRAANVLVTEDFE